jgi:hypothetical protein
MGIKLIEDVGAPAAVAVVDIALSSLKPTWNEPAMYAATVLGYTGAYMNKGGDFTKNVGIASLPLAAKFLYSRVKTMAGIGGRTQARVYGRGSGVSGYSRGGISDMVKPEFANIGVG